jgi:hypothetical protein
MTAVAPAARTRCAAYKDHVRPNTLWPRAVRTLISSVPTNPAAPVMNAVTGRLPDIRPVWCASARANTDNPRTGVVRHPYSRGVKMKGP